MCHYKFKLYLFPLFHKFICFLIISHELVWIIKPNYGMTRNYELGMTSKEAAVVYFELLH